MLLKQLLDNPQLLDKFKLYQPRCTACGKATSVGVGRLCEDCYYERLGELIDHHPIVSPRTHRH